MCTISDKAIIDLHAIILGIKDDGLINDSRDIELSNWCLKNTDHVLYPEISRAYTEGYFTQAEIAAILCLC